MSTASQERGNYRAALAARLASSRGRPNGGEFSATPSTPGQHPLRAIFREVRHEGWLRKLSSAEITSRWQQRYFVLDATTLKYYANKNFNEEPRKTFALHMVTSVQIADERKFELISDNHCTVSLQASSDADLTLWTTLLAAAIDQARKSPPVEADLPELPQAEEPGSVSEDEVHERERTEESEISAQLPHLDALYSEWFRFTARTHAAKAAKCLEACSRAMGDLSREVESENCNKRALTKAYVARLIYHVDEWLDGISDHTEISDLPALVEWLVRTGLELDSESSPEISYDLHTLARRLAGELKLAAIEKFRASETTSADFMEKLAEQFGNLRIFSERFPAAHAILRQATSDAIMVALSVRQRRFLAEISRARTQLAKANRYLAKLLSPDSSSAAVSLGSLLPVASESLSLGVFSRQVADEISDSLLTACLVDHGVAFRGICDCALELAAHFFFWHPWKRKFRRTFSSEQRWSDRLGFLVDLKAQFEHKHAEALTFARQQQQVLVLDLLEDHLMQVLQRGYLVSLVKHRKSLKPKLSELIQAVALDAAALPKLRALVLVLRMLQGAEDADEMALHDDEMVLVLGAKYGARVLRGVRKFRSSLDEEDTKKTTGASSSNSEDHEDDDRIARRITTLQSNTLTPLYR